MHHYYHHHCPEMRRMMTSNDLNQHNVSECKKPSNGKLLQHWLQLQQHPTEKKSSLCPTTEEGQDNKPVSSENIPPVDRYSRSQVNKLVCKESHGRKSHHHHHHNHHHHSHSHRKTSAQRTNSNNTNPKHSSHTNTESNSCRQHSDEDDDDDDNMTTSARLDRKLSSSSSSAAAAAMTNVHQQQTSHINPTTTPVSSSGPQGLVVGYYLCDDPVPYRTVWTGPPTSGSHSSNNNNNSNNNNQSSSSSSALFVEVSDHSETVDNYQTKQLTSQSLLTLGQFKQLIAKKGVYRYFFKKPNDEFGTGVVHEELTNDDSILPLWEGKVVARVERAD
ncbi:unnamed protein product [Heterobilharzia americana]|nr:unnamed protein product [Heterobilharzia americana]